MTKPTNTSAYRAARRKADSVDAVTGCAIMLAILALLPAFAALGALLTMLAWNLGVVAIVAACGGHVAHIGFWTALFANIAIGVVGRIFRRTEVKAAS